MFAIMPMETEGHGREFGRRQKMRAKCTVEFVCKYCQRRFTKPYNLMIHERSHKDDVTFTCEVCGKSFKRQDNLKQHRYISSGIFFRICIYVYTRACVYVCHACAYTHACVYIDTLHRDTYIHIYGQFFCSSLF